MTMLYTYVEDEYVNEKGKSIEQMQVQVKKFRTRCRSQVIKTGVPLLIGNVSCGRYCTARADVASVSNKSRCQC